MENHMLEIKINDATYSLQTSSIFEYLKQVAKGLDCVDAGLIYDETMANIYSGITPEDLHTAILMSVKTKIEIEPEYSYLGARLMIQQYWNPQLARSMSSFEYVDYKDHFKNKRSLADFFEVLISRLVVDKQINLELSSFSFAKLASAIDLSLIHISEPTRPY